MPSLPRKESTRVSTVINGNQTIENTRTYERVTPFEKYFSENFFKTLVGAISGFGLLAIYAYHFSVEYSPTFDFKSAASLVFAVAYSGLSLLVIMSLFTLIPALLIVSCIVDRAKLAVPHYLVKTLGVCFFISFASFLAFTAILVFLDPDKWALLFIPPIVVFALGGIWATRSVGSVSAGLEQGFMLAVACILQFLPLYFYISVLAQPQQNGIELPFDPADFMANTLAVDLFIQLAGLYFAAAWVSPKMKPYHRSLSLLASCFVVFLITVLSGHPNFIGGRIANMTKFGNFYATELTLSKDGCKAINSYDNKICFGSEEGGYKTCGAWIGSRIGAEAYIKIYEGDTSAEKELETANKKSPFSKSMYLPSKDILAMTVYDIKGPVTARDPVLITHIAACRLMNDRKVPTIVPLRGEEFFKFDKSDLGAGGKKMLTGIAERLALLKAGSWTARIQGYADQMGEAEYNLRLSKARASAVAAYLRSQLPAEAANSIIHVGVGSADLRRTNVQCPKTMERDKRIDCLGANRRTEIIIDTPAPSQPDTANTPGK